MRLRGRWGSAGLAWPAIAIAAATAVAPGIARGGGPSTDRWQWLAGTYWYVPRENLPAVASSPKLAAPIPVSDQTVYRIDHYAGGYFWGTTAGSYQRRSSADGSPAPSCLQLVGSVTPEGSVHLTFTSLASKTATADSSAGEPTVGIGAMTRQGGEWTMENQMSTTAAGDLLLTHWAYMRQCRPGEPCFWSLPGVGVSIPEFLGPCLPAPSRPR